MRGPRHLALEGGKRPPLRKLGPSQGPAQGRQARGPSDLSPAGPRWVKLVMYRINYQCELQMVRGPGKINGNPNSNYVAVVKEFN